MAFSVYSPTTGIPGPSGPTGPAGSSVDLSAVARMAAGRASVSMAGYCFDGSMRGIAHSNLTLAASTMYAYPFLATEQMVPYLCGVVVTGTLVPGSAVSLGLYNADSSGMISSLLRDLGAVSTAASGATYVTTQGETILQPDNIYYAAVRTYSPAPTLVTVGTGALGPFFGSTSLHIDETVRLTVTAGLPGFGMPVSPLAIDAFPTTSIASSAAPRLFMQML